MSAQPGRPAQRVIRAPAQPSGWVVVFEDGSAAGLGDLKRNDLRSLGSRMGLSFPVQQGGWSNDRMVAAIFANLNEQGPWSIGQGSIRKGSTRPTIAAEPIRQEEESVQDFNPYPVTRYCPDGEAGHAPVTLNSKAEADMFGQRCEACGEALVNVAPVTIEPSTVAPSTVPMSGSTTVVATTDPALLDRLEALTEAVLATMAPAPNDAPPVIVPDLRHPAFDLALGWLQQGANVFLVGPAGTGKSHLAKQLADAMGRRLFTERCTPDMYRETLTGMRQPSTGEYHQTKLHKALQADGYFCLDEIDNGDSSVTAVLNDLMSDGAIDFPDDEDVQPGPNFRVIATGNTFGVGATAKFMGRTELDAATLNRFARVYVGIDADLERALVERHLPPEQMNRADEIMHVVQTIRERMVAAKFDLRFSPTPRDSIRCAQALAMGLTIADGLRAGEMAALDPEDEPPVQWNKYTEGLI